LEKLLEQLPATQTFPARLPSRLGDRIEFVEVARVTHFYANDKLTTPPLPKKISLWIAPFVSEDFNRNRVQ
jgi:hypothetical protein